MTALNETAIAALYGTPGEKCGALWLRERHKTGPSDGG